MKCILCKKSIIKTNNFVSANIKRTKVVAYNNYLETLCSTCTTKHGNKGDSIIVELINDAN